MTMIAINSAADSSPGLKSQLSAEEASDVENMDDHSVSQTAFATQIPLSPPKPLEKASPQRGQLLGKRKVMADLRQLVSDSVRVPKKNKFCAEVYEAVNGGSTAQPEIARDGIITTSSQSIVRSERTLQKEDVSNNTSDPSRQSDRKASLQGLDTTEAKTTNRQPPSASAGNIVSKTTAEDHLQTFTKRWDQLSNLTYLPRHLQTISRAQNDLLAVGDSWQPALVGQPNRPGTLPLDLLKTLTAAADQKAAAVNDLVPSNQQDLAIYSEVPEGEVGNVEEEQDQRPNSPTLKNVNPTDNPSPNEAQGLDSDSGDTAVEWSSSPSRSPPLRRLLPPDSSPLTAPKGMPEPSPLAEGYSRLITRYEESALLSSIPLPSISDGLQSSCPSRRHSNNQKATPYISTTDTDTSSYLQKQSASETLSAAVRTSTFQADLNSLPCSTVRSPSVKRATTGLRPILITKSSEDCGRRKVDENNHIIQVFNTPNTPRPLTSNTPQPLPRQETEYTVETLQKNPINQQLPPLSSPHLIPGTFLQDTVGSRPTGSVQDSHESKEFMEQFEVNSSEDGSLHGAYTADPVGDHQGQDEDVNASRQAMMQIQCASQVVTRLSSYLIAIDNGTTANSKETYSNTSLGLEDRAMGASEPEYLGKPRQDDMDQEKVSGYSEPAESTTASSLLSVSSEDPDSRRVDIMTRQYRPMVYTTIRKIDPGNPLPPSPALASSASLQSECLESHDKQDSAQSSIFRHVTTSIPVTSFLAQAQKVLREPPPSTSDLSENSPLWPKDQFLVFKQNYPTYGGNFARFLLSCCMIKRIRNEGKLLPQGVWDDFVHRHSHDYRSYVDHVAQSSELESPMPYEEYYTDFVSEPVHLKGILKIAFINTLDGDLDPIARPDMAQVRETAETNHLHGNRRSIAASSSVSGIPPEELSHDRIENMTEEENPMTLENQLRLKEQEVAHKGQPSSVHLWLQSGSGAASSELGTPDRLAATVDVPYIDLTGNEEEETFNLVRELQTLKDQHTNTRKNSRTGPVEETCFPKANTEQFKYFTLGHARLDMNEYGTSQIQTDTKGVLRPGVQRTFDIFRWTG